ncbi:hypothetical protein PMAYCL1PPCAC_04423, partial [Pristionchus mayeri]
RTMILFYAILVTYFSSASGSIDLPPPAPALASIDGDIDYFVKKTAAYLVFRIPKVVEASVVDKNALIYMMQEYTKLLYKKHNIPLPEDFDTYLPHFVLPGEANYKPTDKKKRSAHKIIEFDVDVVEEDIGYGEPSADFEIIGPLDKDE